MKDIEIKNPQKGTLNKLTIAFIKSNPALVITSLVFLFLGSASIGLVGIVMTPVIDGIVDVINNVMYANTYIYQHLIYWIYFLLISGSIGVFCSFVASICLAYAGQFFLDKLKSTVFKKYASLPLSYYDTHKKGDILSLCIDDIEALRQYYVESLQTYINGIIVFLILIGTMVCYSLYFAAIILVATILILLITLALRKKANKNNALADEASNEEIALLDELLDGISIAKAFNYEDAAKAKFDTYNKKWTTASSKAQGSAIIISPICTGLGYLAYILIAIIGGLMIALEINNTGLVSGTGAMTIGTIVSFLPLAQLNAGNIQQMTYHENDRSLAKASAARIGEFLALEEETDEGTIEVVKGNWEGNVFIESKKEGTSLAWKDDATYLPVKGAISIKDIDYSYEGKKDILHALSLEIKPGQTVVLSGESGTGKTTLLNLLSGYEKVADDKIKIDDIDINKIKKSSLHYVLNIINSSSAIFTGTVLDNIRYGKKEASNDECVLAAKAVGADDFIRALPKGYHTIIESNNNTFTPGQIELIALARASLSLSPVLVLNKATLALDCKSEKDVLDSITKGKTVLAITNHPYVIKKAETAFTLKEGTLQA